MQHATQLAPTSKAGLWAGRVISLLVVLFLLFDAGIKLMKLPPAVEGTVKLGYPVSVVVPLGMVLLACVLLYIIPRTSILGAILLTGYLGGATATNVRVQNPWILFPVGIGVLAWVGLYLRDERLQTLFPLRKA